MESEAWRKWRLVKTVCLVLAWLSAGTYASMARPALMDLTEIAHCNYEQLAMALTAKNIGLTVTSLLSAYFCSRFQRHLEAILSINLIILGLCTAAVPWCTLLPVMAIPMFGQGLSHGVLGVVGNSWVAVMWEGSSSTPLQALHFGNSIGSLVAPLILGPFLSGNSNSTIKEPDQLDQGNSSANGTIHPAPTRIQIPFGACGIYTVFWGVVFCWFYVTTRRSSGTYQSMDNSDSQCYTTSGTFAGVKRSFGIFMTALFFLLYLSFAGIYGSIPTYIMPISVEGRLHLNKPEANLLVFGYSVALVLGRLAGTVLSKCVSVHLMFFIFIVMSFVVSLLLTLYALDSVMFLWVLLCALGFVSGPIFPAGIGWAEVYLDIKGPLMAVFFTGTGVGTLLVQWLSGYGVQNMGIYFPIYAGFGCAILATALYVVAVFRAWRYGPRQTGDAKEQLGTEANNLQ